MDKILKHKIVSRLKGFEQEAKSLRQKIKRIESKERYSYKLTLVKYILGVDTRHYLLAYALLRGLSYKTVEGKCREDNKPNVFILSKIIDNLYNDHYDFGKNVWTQDKIKEWLGV